MPLLDHFHPPLYPQRNWESFHASWAGAIADALNQRSLPEGYFAEVQTHLGARVEIDVATFDASPGSGPPAPVAGTATLTHSWAPPAPRWTIPGAFPDTFEILVFGPKGEARLIAAIELVSPANKDRISHRRAFAIKCGSYLAQGVSLIIVDIVTNRQANLHDDVVTLWQHPGACWSSASGLYAAAYRPIIRAGNELIDVWVAGLALGQAMPTLPLALNADVALPIDLEATYTDACRRRRLPA